METSKEWLEKVEGLINKGMSADKALLKVKKDHPELFPKAGQFFEDKVNANFRAGLNQAESVRKAVTDYPELHKNWVARLKTGKNAAVKDLFVETSDNLPPLNIFCKGIGPTGKTA